LSRRKKSWKSIKKDKKKNYENKNIENYEKNNCEINERVNVCDAKIEKIICNRCG
jgi:hypothetical protein